MDTLLPWHNGSRRRAASLPRSLQQDRRHGPCPVAALHASTLEYVSAPQTIDTGAPPVSYTLPVKRRPGWRAGSGTTISGTPSCVVIMLPSKVVSTFVAPSRTT